MLPFILTVIIIAGVVSATAWWLSDTVGAASKVEADARKIKQQTIAELVARAKTLRAQGKESQATKLEQAAGNAISAADAPPPGLLDQIISGAAVVGATGVGIGVLALLWALSRRKSSSGPKRQWRSPVTFHKPVSFHKPATFRSPVH